MAINIVPIIPTKQIVVSNTQLCILLWRPFKAQENVYVSSNAARGKKIVVGGERDFKY